MRTCIGDHVSPCWRFHPYLTRRGHTHECKPCRDADERHELRHREIAFLTKSLGGQPGPQTSIQPPQIPAKTSAIAPGSPLYPSGGNANSNRLRKKDKKEIKRSTKAAQRKEEAVAECGVTSEELKHIWTVIHPQCDRDAAVRKPMAVVDMRKIINQHFDETDSQVPNFDKEVSRILQELSIPSIGKASKERRQLSGKLKASVNDDLVQFFIEDIARIVRQKEFCTWAARSALQKELDHGMVRSSAHCKMTMILTPLQNKDWRTGDRIYSDNEQEESSSDESENEVDGVANLFGNAEAGRRIIAVPGRGYVYEDSFNKDTVPGPAMVPQQAQDEYIEAPRPRYLPQQEQGHQMATPGSTILQQQDQGTEVNSAPRPAKKQQQAEAHGVESASKQTAAQHQERQQKEEHEHVEPPPPTVVQQQDKGKQTTPAEVPGTSSATDFPSSAAVAASQASKPLSPPLLTSSSSMLHTTYEENDEDREADANNEQHSVEKPTESSKTLTLVEYFYDAAQKIDAKFPHFHQMWRTGSPKASNLHNEIYYACINLEKELLDSVHKLADSEKDMISRFASWRSTCEGRHHILDTIDRETFLQRLRSTAMQNASLKRAVLPFLDGLSQSTQRRLLVALSAEYNPADFSDERFMEHVFTSMMTLLPSMVAHSAASQPQEQGHDIKLSDRRDNLMNLILDCHRFWDESLLKATMVRHQKMESWMTRIELGDPAALEVGLIHSSSEIKNTPLSFLSRDHVDFKAECAAYLRASNVKQKLVYLCDPYSGDTLGPIPKAMVKGAKDRGYIKYTDNGTPTGWPTGNAECLDPLELAESYIFLYGTYRWGPVSPLIAEKLVIDRRFQMDAVLHYPFKTTPGILIPTDIHDWMCNLDALPRRLRGYMLGFLEIGTRMPGGSADVETLLKHKTFALWLSIYAEGLLWYLEKYPEYFSTDIFMTRLPLAMREDHQRQLDDEFGYYGHYLGPTHMGLCRCGVYQYSANAMVLCSMKYCPDSRCMQCAPRWFSKDESPMPRLDPASKAWVPKPICFPSTESPSSQVQPFYCRDCFKKLKASAAATPPPPEEDLLDLQIQHREEEWTDFFNEVLQGVWSDEEMLQTTRGILWKE